jgi:hypothetical protein
MSIETSVAMAAILSTCAVANIPVDPATIEAVAKWPLTVLFAAVACFCVWLNYKQSQKFADAAQKAAESTAIASAKVAESSVKAATENAMMVAKAVNDLVSELKQRPCIRDPKND